MVSVDLNIVIVVATVMSIFAFSAIVAGWVGGTRNWVAVIALIIGTGMLTYAHLSLPDGLGFFDVPDAFINVLAMVVN